MCVRFDRHAVYLGAPTAQERCPAHAVGRTEAILLQPANATIRRALRVRRRRPPPRPRREGRGERRFSRGRAGVVVTATWSHDARSVADALNRPSLPRERHGAAPRRTPWSGARARTTPRRTRPRRRLEGSGSTPAAPPPPTAMTAWGASPYRAIGIYIGGVNSACAQPQPDLHMGRRRGRRRLAHDPDLRGPAGAEQLVRLRGDLARQASAQGTAAAIDAVADAQGIGIPAGNPIYNDMEGYSRSPRPTPRRCSAFLSAWTTQLARRGLPVGRVQQHRLRVSADLVRAVRHELRRARRHLVCRVERPADGHAAPTSRGGLVQQPAPAPIPRRPQRDLRRGHDQHRQQLPRRSDRRHVGDVLQRAAAAPAADAEGLAGHRRHHVAVDELERRQRRCRRGECSPGPSATPTRSLGSPRRAHAAPAQRIMVRSAAPAFAVQALDTTGSVLATRRRSPRRRTSWSSATARSCPSGPGLGGIPVGCYTGRDLPRRHDGVRRAHDNRHHRRGADRREQHRPCVLQAHAQAGGPLLITRAAPVGRQRQGAGRHGHQGGGQAVARPLHDVRKRDRVAA